MIEIRGLVKRFGGLQVLRGVDLQVRRGEVAVLIGASGCGKTTLLRCINALEVFEAGHIRVGDLTVGPDHSDPGRRRLEHQLRQRAGMVFQQFNLFPHLSVLENVMCGPVHGLGVSREQAAEKARQLLHRVGLSDKISSRPSTLSGGQQQRVAIARALANDPEVMLFDEPTSALDPKMTAEVLAVMANLATGGQTMIVASHAMGFVRRTADSVHVMAGGQIIESGPPEQVFEDSRHPHTRELLAAAAD